ncbi:MAG: Nif3-like dinuclear metal center hexameric protein, partial [Actinomycetota bacterium]
GNSEPVACSTVPQLAEVIAAVDSWFDPAWAQSWDAVGLVCGDPAEPVDHVLLAVDPVAATVDEAIGVAARLLITHHPLLLTPVHGVPTSDPKSALVHRMIRNSVAHYVVHTNADVADPGVSDALAARIGLREVSPLESEDDPAVDKLVVFVPTDDAQRLIDVLADAGAGRIGGYERCAWTVEGIGTFRPGVGTSPVIGERGRVESVGEMRVEMVLPGHRRGDVLRALHAAHPYETPAFDLVATSGQPTTRGTGRVGDLVTATTLREFTAHVAAVLPRTTWGVRAAGEPDLPVRTVAVCGGSGGSLVDQARRAGADAYVTADLKHHPALEAVTEHGSGAMGLVDAAHWATEAPWLDAVAERLTKRFGTGAAGLKVTVSTTVTDPWTLHTHTTETRL